jgi:hypothetical protein
MTNEYQHAVQVKE